MIFNSETEVKYSFKTISTPPANGEVLIKQSVGSGLGNNEFNQLATLHGKVLTGWEMERINMAERSY
jgi:hypothetical protein